MIDLLSDIRITVERIAGDRDHLVALIERPQIEFMRIFRKSFKEAFKRWKMRRGYSKGFPSKSCSRAWKMSLQMRELENENKK